MVQVGIDSIVFQHLILITMTLTMIITQVTAFKKKPGYE